MASAQTASTSRQGPAWPPELELLRRCAQWAADKSLRIEVPEPMDWEGFASKVEQHGISGVCSHALEAAIVPEVIRERLKLAGRSTVQHGLALVSTLLEVTAELNQGGIPCLAYKGPALSAQLFGDAALRSAVDVDLLISPNDVGEAIAILEKAGFVPIRAYPASAMKQLVAFRAEYGMTRNGMLVELQWRTAPCYFSTPFDFARSWERRVAIEAAGRTLDTLCAEDNLVTLCVHGSKHHWSSLKWILDIHILKRSAAIEWTPLLNRAANEGTLRIVLTSLQLVHSVLGGPLPFEAEQMLAKDATATAIAEVMAEDLRTNRKIDESYHHRLMLRLRERLSDRGRYLLRLAYQPSESEWQVNLPIGLQWLYYPLRSARFVVRLLSARAG
jgi:hypothetical protein